MYLKLPDTYPYDLSHFKTDFPDTSPPDVWSDALLASIGIVPVTPTTRPEVTHEQATVELPPQQINGVWTQVWQVIDRTEDDKAAMTAAQAEQVRAERDRRLVETDWWVTRAYEAQTQISTEQAAYRQALRDVPNQAGFPWNVTWP